MHVFILLDALEYNRKIAEEKSHIIEELELESGKYLVITIHRPDNTDSKENMSNIIEALEESGERVVFPVHPRTEKFLQEYGMWDSMPEIVVVIEPVGYNDMLKLMSGAEKILTDSGGMQKEAYVLGVPCITLRENTEWVETLDGGWNVLVGAKKGMIVKALHDFAFVNTREKVFDGEASRRFLNVLGSI